jgi:hypothetical protein
MRRAAPGGTSAWPLKPVEYHYERAAATARNACPLQWIMHSDFVQRAGRQQVALEQAKSVNLPGRPQVGVTRQLIDNRAGATVQARDRDVRCEASGFATKSGQFKRPVDLRPEPLKLGRGPNTCPDGGRHALRSKCAPPSSANSKDGNAMLAKAAARSIAASRSTLPTKRIVRCNCSSSCQRAPSSASIVSISASRTRAGGRMPMNKRWDIVAT